MARQGGEKEHFGGLSGGEITANAFKGLHDRLCPLYSGGQAEKQMGKEGVVDAETVEMSGFKTEQMSGFKGAARVRESIITEKNNSQKYEKVYVVCQTDHYQHCCNTPIGV